MNDLVIVQEKEVGSPDNFDLYRDGFYREQVAIEVRDLGGGLEFGVSFHFRYDSWDIHLLSKIIKLESAATCDQVEAYFRDEVESGLLDKKLKRVRKEVLDSLKDGAGRKGHSRRKSRQSRKPQSTLRETKGEIDNGGSDAPVGNHSESRFKVLG